MDGLVPKCDPNGRPPVRGLLTRAARRRRAVMTGHRSFSEIREKAGDGPDREVRRVQARAALKVEIAAYESTLAELRRARGVTQQQLAKVLELTQPQVS